MAWFEHGTSRIYYEVYGSGDPILLLPGLTGSIQEFAALRETLVGAGYRVIEADLPGSGRSLPLPRKFPVTYYEDDSRTFMALLHELDAEPAHLMGFSDGGELSLLMAALNPSIARSVVAWGAAGSVNDPNGFLRQVLGSVVDNPMPMMQQYSEQLIAAYGKENARTTMQNVVVVFNELIEAGGNISRDVAGNITCPVLLMVGKEDFSIPAEVIADLAARIGEAELITLEGAGHEPFHLTRTGWLAPIILDWLKRHQPIASPRKEKQRH